MATTAKPEVVRSKSLLGDDAAPHVQAEDVDSFMELIKAGVIPSAPMRCAAVQDNVALRSETRRKLVD